MSKSDLETLQRGNIYFGSTRGLNTSKLAAALTKDNVKFTASISSVTATFYVPASAYKECQKRYSNLLLSPSER